MQQTNVTLRSVVSVFLKRLGNKKPLTYRFQEQNADYQRQPVVIGAEIVFEPKVLTPLVVRRAMKGVTFVGVTKGQRKASYTDQVQWEHKSDKIKFRTTLRVHRDGRYSFNFTTIW